MKILVLLLIFVSATWAKPGGRIVGGQLARSGQFPFAVAIYSTRDGGTFFCGGSLINNQWILTGGQCVQNAVSFRLQLGANHLSAADNNRVILATSTYIIHPQYNPTNLQNDIGLIKTRLPVEFNGYITPGALPSGFTPDYTTVTAIGWGQEHDFSAGLSDDLLYTTLTTISNDECQLTYGGAIGYNMMCAAGNFNEGTCNGDMGGPLIQTTVSTSVIIGIASFTSQNGCDTTEPSGYTRIVPYVDWINSSLESN